MVGIVIANMNRWFLGAGAEAESALRESGIPDEEMSFASSLRPFVLAWVLAERDALARSRGRSRFLEDVPENRRTLDLARQWLGEGA